MRFFYGQSDQFNVTHTLQYVLSVHSYRYGKIPHSDDNGGLLRSPNKMEELVVNRTGERVCGLD